MMKNSEKYRQMKKDSLFKTIMENKDKEPQEIYSIWAQKTNQKYGFQDAVDIEEAIKTIQKSSNKILDVIM